MIFTEGNFTEDEIYLLKLAFKLVDDIIDAQYNVNHDNYWRDVIFELKEKLGVGDIV